MATFFLVRHATAEGTGKILTGRKPGMHLTKEGAQQAAKLAHQFSQFSVQHIFSSPLERARETATAIGKAVGLPVQISDALMEIEFGDWTGRLIPELEPLDHWKQWNLFRSGRRIPNGEMLSEVQERLTREIERLFSQFPNDSIALVSHGEPIRTILAYYIGIPVDLQHRLEISPASVSTLELTHWGAKLLGCNLHFE